MITNQSTPNAPASDDIRHDDLEFNPQLEPKKAKAWLNLLEESEKAFEPWNDHCDKIEKQYANLARLAQNARDKEFQMFWANIEVEKPSIYAKPPQPVVVTKFKDRRPVPQAAAEILERINVVAFDLTHIDEVMKQMRDDVVLNGRGVPWARYESKNSYGSFYNSERVCIDFKHRKDFLHSVSRCWYEVWWVAGAAYLTREEARDRFHKYSGDEYQDAEYTVDKDSKELGGTDNRERAKFWEIWDKKNYRVVWVAKGCENILDEDDPHLDLTDFFPCPKPAYGVTQPGSLVPVPDILQYKDQLDEINLLTAKIHALSDALEAKGFYPAGGAELGDAIQAAIAVKTPGRLLVPISNWAAFGGSKEVIVWLPMVEIAQTITSLQQLRQQIIQDVYQIKGLSDIMRGATDPRETMGAQELKTQFGSIRTRDKQDELVRVARDLVVIASDIMLDQFEDKTIIEMSQTQLPTTKMKRQMIEQMQAQLQKQQQAMQMIQTDPQIQQKLQASPEQAQQLQTQGPQLLQAGQQAIDDLMQKPTFEQVMTFLRDMRTRAFVLDIETDSTILIDENTEKQRRTEFVGVLAQLIPQLSQMVVAQPEMASFAGELLKFATAPFRAGRSMDTAIDSAVNQLQAKANQPRGDDPTTAANKITLQVEQMKDQTNKQKNADDKELRTREMDMKDQTQRAKIASTERIQLGKLQQQQTDNEADKQKTQLEMIQTREDAQAKRLDTIGKMRLNEQKMQMAAQQNQQKQQDFANRAAERRALQQFRVNQQAYRPPGGAM